MEMLPDAISKPLKETRSGASILEDLSPFECHKPTLHHVVENRKECRDLIFRVTNLDDDRLLVRCKHMWHMQPTGMAIAKWPLQNRAPANPSSRAFSTTAT
jgi:hypothetical protein